MEKGQLGESTTCNQTEQLDENIQGCLTSLQASLYGPILPFVNTHLAIVAKENKAAFRVQGSILLEAAQLLVCEGMVQKVLHAPLQTILGPAPRESVLSGINWFRLPD